MNLKLIIDNDTMNLEVPYFVLQEGQDFFHKLDNDMDQGWQIARQFVEKPDTLQRCQIVADRMLSALHTENKKSAVLLAGYMLSKFPQLETIHVDTTGEPSNTRFVLTSGESVV